MTPHLAGIASYNPLLTPTLYEARHYLSSRPISASQSHILVKSFLCALYIAVIRLF